MWTTVEISGRPADVFLPQTEESAEETKFPGAVIYLHAHGEEKLSEKPEFTQIFEQHGLPIVCPRGAKSWWLDVICKDFDDELTPMEFIRRDVTAWIEQQWDVTSPRIALLGISMGGQGALNLSYRHALKFPVVVAISSAVELHKAYGYGFPIDNMFESAEEARQQAPLLHLHPLNWPRFQFLACDPMDPTWLEGNEILASKLASSGIPFENDFQTSLGGHTWEYFAAMTDKGMTFISTAIQKLQT
ncbi:putative esterase [Thalassoglobus neptunius]|uniref:Putative esterase n=1 Tax=Thalassoglobus neptunius TaxID=1938619 RepID=A0A5C5X757_9PLAN|nr:alpha/beta hydrolase-fold protein [Thalassoglobus neptunius]TWT58770.1 putative esterase [Thalassoglobus neptunius]